MNFTFSIDNPNRQYLQIEAEIEVSKNTTELYFPAWRPGRYELGDFAKNINYFSISDENNEDVNYHKVAKNKWIVQTSDCKIIKVSYHYFANELNAGSTFLDENQLYVNPVNCCIFTDEVAEKPITVQLNIPSEWKVAHSLKVEKKCFTAKNYDELADSPFICSPNLKHKKYTTENVTFHVWLNGEIKPEWGKLIPDFKRFSQKQIEVFGEFPTDEYHFLFQLLPYTAYHGVEHCKSTVITLGPSYAVFKNLYTELLGVSSHELYHTWNVKSIRPSEWLPYNFTTESYSELGYIVEGVTTYMGDLMLFRSGVFDEQQYFKEMNVQIQKHQDNFGRENYSVAASSFDTWLDGYVKGVPHRKVSIYTEGSLLAFIADVLLMSATNGEKRLDDALRILYYEFGKKKIGVTAKDYQLTLEKISGQSFQHFFDDFVNGTTDYLPLLTQCFNKLGITINQEDNRSFLASKWGIKTRIENNKTIVDTIFPDSSYDISGGMIGDEIIAINSIKIDANCEEWASYFKEDKIQLLINRNQQIHELKLKIDEKSFYQHYFLSRKNQLDDNQNKLYNCWTK